MDINNIQEKLNNALQERNRIFPQRDEQNDRKVEKALTGFVDQINSMQSTQFVPDPALAVKAQSTLDSPVFLCGPMKSGTTLLLELLDGHSELITLPGDSFFWGKLSRENPPPVAVMQAEWDRWLKRMVNPTGQEPFWVFGYNIQPYVEFRQYLQNWFDKLPNTWHSSVVSVMLSYYCANPARPSAPKMWVEKTPGNECRLDTLVRNFPDARFIHIVRDPRENMASLKRLYETRDWQWDPIGTAGTLAESCRLADENRKQMGRERYHVLTYESLTEDPEGNLEEISEFFGIKWENSLLKPTVNGRPAHANSMYEDRRITGMVRRPTKDKWKSVLTKAEQRAALGTLPEAKKMGYEWQNTVSDSVLLMFEKGWATVRRSLAIQK